MDNSSAVLVAGSDAAILVQFATVAFKLAGSGRAGVCGALVALLAAPALLAGCGAGDGAENSSTLPVEAPLVAEQGPFLQMCGGVGDAEFLQTVGLADDVKVLRNLVGCEWNSAAGEGHGSFTWYRGSPIEREYTIVDTVGRTVRTISVDGHEGYEGRTTDGLLCEVGIGLGDDFFVWSLVLPPAPGRDTCAVAKELAMTTLERAQ